MAAIEVSGNARNTGSGRMRTRMSTRFDMTPMVDLGFLLITFFMLATTMSKPTSISAFFPAKGKEDGLPIKGSGALTIFLGSHDQVYYLDGIAPNDEKASASLKTTDAGIGLRKVIFAAHKRVSTLEGRPSDDRNALVIVIKPTAVSTYKNMVDVMDEMAITKSRRYALVDYLTDAEKELLGDRIEEKK